jgi:hypothetical protein
MNRSLGELQFVEGNMADVAQAEFALRRMWVRLRSMCRRPVVSLEDLDAIGEEMRLVEQGLAAARRGLVEDRRELE